MYDSDDPKIKRQSDLSGDGRKQYGYIRELKHSSNADENLVVEFLAESHLCHLLDKI